MMLSTNKITAYCRRLSHVYKKLYIPSSQVAEECFLHYGNGLLVLNKPYGISFSLESSQLQDIDPMEVSLKTILPFIKKKLGCTNIYSIRVPEKYISGVAIFSTEEGLQKKLHKSLLRMRREGLPSDIYQSVVIGEPSRKVSHFQGAIKLESSPTSAKDKRVSIVSSCNRKQRVKGIAKNVLIAHRTLSTSEKASLVEVAATRNSWHCVRAYLSTVLLTPALGDNIYGSCVKQILGKPILVDKFSPVAGLPQKLSPEILAALNLTSVKDVEVPLHLHLKKIIIDHFDRNDATFDTFVAPTPKTFTWTCDRLGLVSNTESE